MSVFSAPRTPQPASTLSTGRRILAYLGALGLGALVAAVGTVAHRQWMPWILLVALVMVGAAAVMVRAWLGGGGLLPYGIGWLGVVQLLATTGPGGDVLLPGEPVSYVWMAGGMAMIAFAAFSPRRWYSA